MRSSVETGARGERRRSSEAPTLRFHRVAAGETLVGIARRHYGDESFWVVLCDANRDLLGESGELKPGLTLYLPFL
jgi:nucleoid-associated protein YgaU